MAIKVVEEVLSKIETLIQQDEFQHLETEKLEIKDLSSSEDWKELYRSICAFLNSQGGIVIIGILERDKKYRVTGFNPNLEDKLKEIPKYFTDELKNTLDLTEYVRVDLAEVREMMGKRVCILPVEKLPEDKKFVFYKGNAFQRKLTGDHRLTIDEVKRQQELRDEIISTRELGIVEGASLDTLDVDKLNEYIQRLNQGVKVETLKADIDSAQSFLERKKFLVSSKPTLLGMLVCGDHLYDFIEGRCQVDCFVVGPVQIAENKKVFKDNIIQLLEKCIGFVFNNIATGISSDRGGSTTFQYPERLIRETVNNALAHRDYTSSKFVNITIFPGKSIEVRNPGSFRAEQVLRLDKTVPIRRIIPIPRPHNPRLADVLKSFDRWEGKGWGMASLTNEALENRIDLPYYHLFSQEDIGLVIPAGKILDDESESWLKSFDGFIFKKTNGHELTIDQKTALAYFRKSELYNRDEKYTIALTPDNNHFSVINELKTWGLIQRIEGGDDLYPIYIIDRELLKTDFTNELRGIYGGAFDILGSDYKKTLNMVYHLNHYGLDQRSINAAQIGDYIFYSENKKIEDVKGYNDYKRKIRNIINGLTKKAYILKSEGGRPSYSINKNFSRTKSLFDSE